jgi:hypothetical protein
MYDCTLLALQRLAVQGPRTLSPFQRRASVSLLTKAVSFSAVVVMSESPFPCSLRGPTRSVSLFLFFPAPLKPEWGKLIQWAAIHHSSSWQSPLTAVYPL